MRKTLAFMLTSLAGLGCVHAVPVPLQDAPVDVDMHGRFLLDTAHFTDAPPTMDDGTEFRSARLGLDGNIGDNWGFKAQYDFGGNDATLKNVYITYRGLEHAEIRIGQFKQFFGLARMTSNKYTTFMETATPTVFAPSYRLGVGYLWKGNDLTFGASVYGNRAGDGSTNDGLRNVATRLTWAPVHHDRQILHLGISLARESVSDTHSIGFSARPEAHLSPKLVGVSVDHADHLGKADLELAWVGGPFSAQGEWVRTRVHRTGHFGAVDLGGYYVQASWFATGESRPYAGGSFGHVIPRSSRGAWQVAARFSHIDLADGIFDGGDMNNLTVGLNYYLNRHIRFMANVGRARVTHGADTEHPYSMQLRAQLAF